MTDPLHPDLQKLFEMERSLPEETGEVKQRVLVGVRAVIAAGGPGGGGPADPDGGPLDGSPDGSPPDGPPPGGSPPGGSPIEASSHAAGRGLLSAITTLATNPAVTALVGVGLGAIAGAVGTAIVMESRMADDEPNQDAPDQSEQVEAVLPDGLEPPDVVVGDEAADPPSDPVQVAGEETPEVPVDQTPGEVLAVDSPEDQLTGLERELLLIDRARSALVLGRPEQALEALTEHEWSYPSGRFDEERDALMVQALWAAGRPEDATIRAKLFDERYPDSTMRPSQPQ